MTQMTQKLMLNQKQPILYCSACPTYEKLHILFNILIKSVLASEIVMGVETTKPRRAINKSTKTRIVFDEKKRKEFLTGFRKRKDERRQKWKDKVDKDLKNEIQRIKDQTRAKVKNK